MKKIEQYQCEKCKTLYANKRDAEKCEKSHKHISEIVDVRYQPYTTNATGYPDRIVVRFTDGKDVVFKRG